MPTPRVEPVAEVKPEVKPAAVPESKVEPGLSSGGISSKLDGVFAGGDETRPPPKTGKKWLRWLIGAAVLAVVVVYMNGKPGGKSDSACNDAIDSGLKLIADGSLDGARGKLATAKLACTGKSSAKTEDLQAAINKAGAASPACQRSVRNIERELDGQRLMSAGKAIDKLDADCAGAATVEQLRKQLARQQAAAASVQVGVRQALDAKDAGAAQNGIAKLEAIDREYPELKQLKADLQALTAAAAPAPAQAVIPAPEPAPTRTVERPAPVERAPVQAAPVDNGAAMRNEMAQGFLRDAERSLLEGKFDAAKTYLDSARRVDPNNARIDSLARRVRERERQVLQTETTIK
ncbi:hypothetical protein [Janthinobacterium aquaticum]|uniref:hypothetical protein n=1 Tax=Janthinobacterium sp. FT58W TaxID=2654254 RepID=UPI00186B5215|nr:hypothetical protein [Janthinobacterium sp. FT58W]